jgi:hypothetical protein
MSGFSALVVLSCLPAGADETIRRLPPSAFPQLPASVRQLLDQRNCLVPQAVHGRSTILVIREGSANPRAELAAFDDEGFSRLIDAVSATRIRQNGKTHAVPDHDAIEDAFVEKASTVRYFHKGKWLELPGAD